MPPTPRLGNPWFVAFVGLACFMIGSTFHANFPNGLIFMGGDAPAPAAPQQQQQAANPTAVASSKSSVQRTPATVDDDPMLGSKTAPVTLIEFTDFQCPYCQRHFLQTFSSIKKDYVDTGKVRYVIRDYPLTIHPNAPKAAEAAGCADMQGKFWEMHDALFSKLADWKGLSDPSATFKGYAKDIGLNASSFDACLDGDKRKPEITKDQSDGAASGITGTPGFWIIGKNNQSQFISGAASYASFQKAFDEMAK